MVNTRHTTSRNANRRYLRRSGLALMDALIGGVLLGIGLTVVLSIGSRSLNNLAEGERRLTASWLADETLSMILVEGPDQYPKLYDLSGSYDYPFEGYTYNVDIDMPDAERPAHVTVLISWFGARAPVQIEADIAPRLGDEEPLLREPIEPIERQERWDAYRDALEEEGL